MTKLYEQKEPRKMDFFKTDWTVGTIFVLCVALAGMSLQAAGLGMPQGATSESRTQISGKAAP